MKNYSLLVLFSILIFAITIKSQSVASCNANYTVAFAGQNCTTTNNPACEHGYECFLGSCVRILNLETPCNVTDQCTSVGLACIKNVCQPKRYAGETCVFNEDCLSLECLPSGRCLGYADGADCIAGFDNRCGPTSFCRFNGTFFANGSAAGSCTPNLGAGANCGDAIGIGFVAPIPLTTLSAACEPGFLCDTFSGLCTSIGSVTVSSNANPVQVAEGALCGFSNLAKKVFNNTDTCYSYCGTGVDDPLCLTGYECLCGSGGVGTCSPDPCVQQKRDIITCMRTNGCKDVWRGPQFQSLIWRSLSNGTCIADKCKQVVWDYECCVTNFGTRGDLTPGVYCSAPASPVPAPALASALSSCFLLLLSVIFFIFVVHL